MGKFWGYQKFPDDEPIVNGEPFRKGATHIYLASYDLSALTALAKMLCDYRCWEDAEGGF